MRRGGGGVREIEGGAGPAAAERIAGGADAVRLVGRPARHLLGALKAGDCAVAGRES